MTPMLPSSWQYTSDYTFNLQNLSLAHACAHNIMMIFNILQLIYSQFQLNFISSIFNIDVAFLP